MPKSAIIVPTNRPERIQQFIEAWRPQFHRANVRLIVVEDAPQWTVKLPDWVEHYCHADINADLKDKAECIPTKSGGCRDYGFWRAWQDETVDMVVSLDDDVLPLEGIDFIGEHWRALETPRNLKWWPLFPGFRLRGEPYNCDTVKPVLNLGLWQGFPDVDAYQQLLDPDCERTFEQHSGWLGSRLIPPGMYYPNCFAPLTPIVMADGTTKAIRDVMIGDRVLTDLAEDHQVLAVTSRQFADSIIRIKPSGGHEEIKSTPEHQILTAEGWKRAGSITKEDYLLIPRLQHKEIILSDEDMYLVGLFLAEGSYSRQGKRSSKPGTLSGIQFSIADHEADTLGADIERIMAKCCETKASCYYSKIGHGLTLAYYNAEMAEWFYKWCGEYSYGKHLHHLLWRSPNIAQLIRGLFRGDGYSGINRQRPVAKFKTTSPTLASQVKLILHGLGYYCAITLEKAKGIHRAAYCLSLYGSNAERFNTEVMGITTNHRDLRTNPAKRYIISDTHILVKVAEIEAVPYEGLVYDLSIEENHTFLAANCVVHNCGMNWSCRREVVPFLYFPRLPEGMKRFDDIWSGLIFKRIADLFGWAVTYGTPLLKHDRASNPLSNLKQEMLGYSLNEEMWKRLDRAADVSSKTPMQTYWNIARYLGHCLPQLEEAMRLMRVWASLFDKPTTSSAGCEPITRMLERVRGVNA